MASWPCPRRLTEASAMGVVWLLAWLSPPGRGPAAPSIPRGTPLVPRAAGSIRLRTPRALGVSLPGCRQPAIRCPEGEQRSNRRRISVDRCFRSLDTEFAGRDSEGVGNDVILGLVVVTALAFDF